MNRRSTLRLRVTQWRILCDLILALRRWRVARHRHRLFSRTVTESAGMALTYWGLCLRFGRSGRLVNLSGLNA
jgi:hypothetical protein